MQAGVAFRLQICVTRTISKAFCCVLGWRKVQWTRSKAEPLGECCCAVVVGLTLPSGDLRWQPVYELLEPQLVVWLLVYLVRFWHSAWLDFATRANQPSRRFLLKTATLAISFLYQVANPSLKRAQSHTLRPCASEMLQSAQNWKSIFTFSAVMSSSVASLSILPPGALSPMCKHIDDSRVLGLLLLTSCLNCASFSCASAAEIKHFPNLSIELCLICVFSACLWAFSLSIYGIMNSGRPREMETVCPTIAKPQSVHEAFAYSIKNYVKHFMLHRGFWACERFSRLELDMAHDWLSLKLWSGRRCGLKVFPRVAWNWIHTELTANSQDRTHWRVINKRIVPLIGHTRTEGEKKTFLIYILSKSS